MLINGSQPQDLAESVLFHPVDNITTHISSWVITTAIDFQPYGIVLNNVLQYALNVRSGLRSVLHNFNNNDHRYAHLTRMIKEDFTSIIDEITLTQNEPYNLIDHTKQPRTKRSILPLGRFFNFLFGTADQKDRDMIKQQVKDMNSNQLAEKKVLEDVISVTNTSIGLINENRLKIYQKVSTISGINETISNIQKQLIPLFTARKFLIPQKEASLYHARIRSLLKQLQNDFDLIRQYMSIHTPNKLTPNIIDSTNLRQELIKIQGKCIPTLALPEDPYTNIWHYYKFLTVASMDHANNLVLMINIPLVDLDSSMTLYKIHSLPIFEPRIKKSLEYQIEGYNVAVTKDNKYASHLTDSEFITCTLAAGHFCSLSTGL